MTQHQNRIVAARPEPDGRGEDCDFVAFHARGNTHRLACVDMANGERLTYGELDLRIAKCTGYLHEALGEPVGKRVAILARNGLDALVLHFACVRSGAIQQPLNWRLSGSEIRQLVDDAKPELLIYQTEFEEAARMAMDGSSVRQTLRISPGDNQFASAVDAAKPHAGGDYGSAAPITLLYTSGTTGKPKGVIITRRSAWVTAFNFATTNEVCARDVLLNDMPLFHVAGLFGVARAALLMGATVLISDRFIPSVALQRMSDPALGITHYFAVPQMAMSMLQDPEFAKSDLSRLKALVIGGAPLPQSVVEQLLAANVMPIEGYGLSEAGTVMGLPLDRKTLARKAGSCGVGAMLIDIRLVGSDGHDVAAGEVGEIWLKGPSVTPGYWNQPGVTAKSFHDGWFKTGDAARCDAEGFYRIVDRWKDMYITGGENVYPAEIEAVLVTHPAIAEAAVVGVPDERWGETGCVYVVARQLVPEADIIEYCRAKLARYKVPRHVRFVKVLPRTGSGKVRKGDLRQEFSKSQ